MEEHFPPNSKRSKEDLPEEKEIQQVVSEPASRRKRSVGRQFKETFFSGDHKTAANHMFFEVLVPSTKEAITEAVKDWIDQLVFGGNHRGRSGSKSKGDLGHVQYDKMGKDPRAHGRGLSPRGRARHDFDEIVLDSLAEGNEVIDTMAEVISRYGEASVADLYTMVGVKPTHVDSKWGWTDLRRADVTRYRGNWLLDLPDPEPLD